MEMEDMNCDILDRAEQAAKSLAKQHDLGEGFEAEAQAEIARHFEDVVVCPIEQSILDEIMAERDAQDEQWGGSTHDDKHTLLDWMGFVGDQCEKFGINVCRRGVDYLETPDARQRLIKVAALAIAALQSVNRKAKQVDHG